MNIFGKCLMFRRGIPFKHIALDKYILPHCCSKHVLLNDYTSIKLDSFKL